MDIFSGAPWPVWLFWVQAQTWKWGWESCLWVHVFMLQNFVMAPGCIPWSGVRRVTSDLVRYCHQTQSFVFPWNASFVTKTCQVAPFWIIEVVWYNRSKKKMRCFSVFGSICRNVDIVLSICEWRRNTLIDVEQSDKAPWMGSRSREPRLAGTCQGLEAMELIEWGTQNWRNKALQDEDTPSCQEDGWNDVFLLGAFRGWLWHGVRLGFRQGGIVSWVLGRRDRPMDKFASEVGGWEDREIEGVGIVWHMLPASRQWWRRWTSATDVGWVRIN